MVFITTINHDYFYCCITVVVGVVVVDDVGFLKYFQLTNNIGPIPLIFTS
jgi:hypothetical protein